MKSKNNRLKNLCATALAVGICATAMGQSQGQEIHGVVRDAMGEPIVGATIVQKGTANGAVSDVNGAFTLRSPKGSTLVISYVGYNTQEVKAGSNIIITLKDNEQTLNDVVVIGYGTAKRSDISGSVASVDMKEALKKSPIDVNNMLQGSVAGVYVSQGSGAPNATGSVRIRGIATINGSADPLYVVDGVQMGSDINYLNPADIEHIEVLKDASATAIYGAKGANGVILVTTKKGAKGQVHVDGSAELGIETLADKLDVLDVDDYARAIRQARSNDGNVLVMPVWGESYDGLRKNIDWQKELTHSALRQNYTASVNGGTDKFQGVFSTRYLDYDGLVRNSKMRRYNVSASFSAQVNKYLELGGHVDAEHSKTYNTGAGNIRTYASMTPTMDYTDDEGRLISPNLVNDNGTYGTFWQYSGSSEVGPGRDNLYASRMEGDAATTYTNVHANFNLGVNILKGLKFKLIYAYNTRATDGNEFVVSRHRYNEIYDASGNKLLAEMALTTQNTTNQFSLSKSNYYDRELEDYLTYNWTNDIHAITLMIGNSVSRTSGSWNLSQASDFPYETIRNISLTNDNDTKVAQGAYDLSSRFISFYGRVMYSLLDRYSLTASVRRDGSSHFGAGNRWGTFPSFAASWRISEEPFAKKLTWLSNAKLRIGWGETGNSGNATDLIVDQLSSKNTVYKFYNEGAATSDFVVKNGMAQQNLIDTNLKWETNKQTNIGLDLGFMKNDLAISIDYFIRNTTDLLLYEAVRPSTGFQRVYTNFGEIRNKGLEFSVAYNRQINRDWRIGAQINGSTISNKVVKCGSDIFSNYGFDQGMHWQNTSLCREGYAVGSWYGYRTDGLFTSQDQIDEANKMAVEKGNKYYQQNAKLGDIRFVDVNGDGTITDADCGVIGDGFPDFNYGINLSAQWKNIDLLISMYGVLGQDILSYAAMNSTLVTSSSSYVPNILKGEYDRTWSSDNPDAANPRLSINDANWNMRCSDFWIRNGNYLKINNIQLGYNFDPALLKDLQLTGARVYFAINNLCTISPYNKYGDPELGGSILFQGVDAGHYPQPRTYVIGLHLQF